MPCLSLHFVIFFNEQDKGLNTLREDPQTTAPASSPALKPADTEQISATTNPSSRKREQKSQQKSSRLASPTSPTSSVGTAVDMLGGAFGDDANEEAQARRRSEKEEENEEKKRKERERSQQQLLDEQRREREQREASEAAERAAAAAARPSTTEEEAARQREEEERRRKQAKEWGDSHHDARGQPASPSKPDNQHRLGAEHDEVSVQSINHYDIVYGIGDDASGSGGAVPHDLDSWATWDDDDAKGGGVGDRGGEEGNTPGSGGCHGSKGGVALMDEGVTFFRFKQPLAVRLRRKQEKEMRRKKQGGRWRRLRNPRSQEPAADDRSLVRIDLMLLSVPSHVLHTIRVYDHTVVGRRSEYLKSVQVFSKGPRSNFEDGPGGAADGVAAGEVAGEAGPHLFRHYQTWH